MARPGSTIERLELAADAPTGVHFVGASVTAEGQPSFVSWRQVHDEARAVGAAFQARGLVPGDHVAILGPTSRGLITAIRGCWMAGIASMVLPLPMRMGSLDAFIESTRARIRHGDAKLVLIDDMLAAFYEAGPGDPPIIPISAVLPGAPGVPSGDRLEVPAPDPERLIVLQYTSGSTSEPKGVMIPDRVLSANIDACAEAAGMQIDDVMLSWLPLYHDMGLIGFLGIPMTTGAGLVQAAPQDFMAHPGNWMQWISDHRATATAGPNFAWVLGHAGAEADEGPRPVLADAGALGRRTRRSQRRRGVRRRGRAVRLPTGWRVPGLRDGRGRHRRLVPPRGRGLVCDTVDRVVLERDRVAKPIEVDDPDDLELVARRLPLLGTPVPGLEMRVVDPESLEERPERHVGELLIRGTSVTPGYYKRPDATAALFDQGWLRTGDLAYMIDGELVLCGRIKDVIIVGGRNVFPEDIERAVGTIEGVRAGNVIAFGMEGYKGKESVVVVAETKADASEHEAIRDAIHHRTLEVCGLPPRDVMLVQPSTLPKTSSGKLQRAKCREQYLEETLELA